MKYKCFDFIEKNWIIKYWFSKISILINIFFDFFCLKIILIENIWYINILDNFSPKNIKINEKWKK
jgi:hypothetical protein